MIIRVLKPIAISIAVFFAIALGLVLSQPPRGPLTDASLGFLSGGDSDVSELMTYEARDGAMLGYREVPGDGAGLLVLVHGSGWHSAAYESLARAVSARSGYRVLLPDLRGHGPKAAPRGDVAYIGQMEDDLADLLDHIGADRAVFAGHSSGGGLVIRMAGGDHAQRMERAVLIAPFLKYNAPTAREDSAWAYPLIRRIIGLSMLNMVGVTALNHLIAIEFSLPQSVRDSEQGQWATDAYSYRLNTGFAPRNDYLGDIAKLPPFLLLAGAEDEAFHAALYEPTMTPATEAGRYVILPGLSHLGVLENAEAADAIADFLAE